MKKKASVAVVILLAILLSAIPALADAPAEGMVVEGHSVPGGVTLGDRRAQVEEKWGEPYICKDQPHFDGRQGIDGICEYEADGLNRVTVKYHAADGTWQSQGTPDDVLYYVLWHGSTSGWVTTAGVNTTLALNDPEAVVAAYPDAEVRVDGDFIYYVGIPGFAVFWHRDPYFGHISVSMAIAKGIPNPEEWLGYSTIADITLADAKIKRNREVTGLVLVHDFQDQPAAGATVTAKWFLPDGSWQTDQAVTSSDGVAAFQLSGRLDRGTYYLIIDDVELTDHIWNYTGGVTSADINVK